MIRTVSTTEAKRLLVLLSRSAQSVEANLWISICWRAPIGISEAISPEAVSSACSVPFRGSNILHFCGRLYNKSKQCLYTYMQNGAKIKTFCSRSKYPIQREKQTRELWFPQNLWIWTIQYKSKEWRNWLCLKRKNICYATTHSRGYQWHVGKAEELKAYVHLII